jgi:hypothetical protein
MPLLIAITATYTSTHLSWDLQVPRRPCNESRIRPPTPITPIHRIVINGIIVCTHDPVLTSDFIICAQTEWLAQGAEIKPFEPGPI